MTTTDQTTKKALWVPGWYELDQSVAVGQNERLWFYLDPPDSNSSALEGESYDFVFFNQLSTVANCQIRVASVLSIDHPTLGSIERIDTDGLDYVFQLDGGERITVNAEEQPGKAYEGYQEVVDWSVMVLLGDVSEPVVDT